MLRMVGRDCHNKNCPTATRCMIVARCVSPVQTRQTVRAVDRTIAADRGGLTAEAARSAGLAAVTQAVSTPPLVVSQLCQC